MSNAKDITQIITTNPIISWTRDTKAINGLYLVYKVYQLYSKGMNYILLPTSTALLMSSVLTSLSPSTWNPMLLMISKLDSTLDTMTWGLTWPSPRCGDQEPPPLFSKSRELYLAPEMDTIRVLDTTMLTITTVPSLPSSPEPLGYTQIICTSLIDQSITSPWHFLSVLYEQHTEVLYGIQDCNTWGGFFVLLSASMILKRCDMILENFGHSCQYW